jgi:hypothetical protein
MSKNDTQGRQASSSSDYTISYWMVGSLDMMGYSAALDRMKVSLDEDSKAALIEAVKVVVTKRVSMLQTVDTVLNAAGAPPPSGLLEELARQEGIRPTDAKAWLRPELMREEGPDHILLMCPLASIAGTSSLMGAFQIFVASSVAMLVQLASAAGRPQFALPLRGGIDVALGLYRPEDHHLYSAARSGAHALESRQAKSPRTIVSAQVLSLLQSHARGQGRSLREQMNAETAQKLLRFLTKDGDFHALDFFGPEMSQFAKESAVSNELALQAWRAANECLQYARETLKDAHVEEKYVALVGYMRPRLHHWRGHAWEKR